MTRACWPARSGASAQPPSGFRPRCSDQHRVAGPQPGGGQARTRSQRSCGCAPRRAGLGNEDTADEAHLLAWAAAARRLAGDYHRGQQLADRAVAAAERCHNLSARAAAYSARTLLAAAQGDPLRTDEYGAMALDAAENADDLLGDSAHQGVSGDAPAGPRTLAEGLREAEIVLDLSERCGHRLSVAVALTHPGTARLRAGSRTPLVTSPLPGNLFQDRGPRFMTWPLNGIATVQRMRGQLTQARATYEEALAIAQPGHEVLGLAGALIGLARFLAAATSALDAHARHEPHAVDELLAAESRYTGASWRTALPGLGGRPRRGHSRHLPRRAAGTERAAARGR